MMGTKQLQQKVGRDVQELVLASKSCKDEVDTLDISLLISIRQLV